MEFRRMTFDFYEYFKHLHDDHCQLAHWVRWKTDAEVIQPWKDDCLDFSLNTYEQEHLFIWSAK